MCFCNVSSELCFAGLASSHIPWVNLQTATFLVSPISFPCVGGSPYKYPPSDLVVPKPFLSHDAYKQIAAVWEPSCCFLAHTRPDLYLDSAGIPCLTLTGPLHRSMQTALHLLCLCWSQLGLSQPQQTVPQLSRERGTASHTVPWERSRVRSQSQAPVCS